LPSQPIINSIGRSFTTLEEVDSTNTYAMKRFQEKLAAHGDAFFAHHQVAGKGQRGKTWNTEPGSNIALSVILDTSFLPLYRQFALSAAVAVATHDLFNNYAGDEVRIKWPNDIYWRDRKAGGILIESSIGSNATGAPQWNGAVAGIGLNINQTSFNQLQNPVSLKQITGKNFSTVELAKELCVFLEKRWQQLKHGKADELLALYNNHLYKKGEKVKLKKDNATFFCVVDSVNEHGELLVKEHVQESFSFGEVQWQIHND